MNSPLTPKEIAKKIKLPLAKWPGKCYEIASAMVDAKIVPGGTAVYGHWIGPIHSRSIFADRAQLGFCNHGWIIMPDGVVIDPTRYVFEACAPYIFHGARDAAQECSGFDPDEEGICSCGHEADEHRPGFFRPCRRCAWPYDEGGNVLRAALRRPAPDALPRARPRYKIKQHLSIAGRFLLAQLFATVRYSGTLTREQCFWLANLPYHALGDRVHEIYDALKACGLEPAIPLDNMRRSERERGRA